MKRILLLALVFGVAVAQARVVDLFIVGSGPAGLAAGIYGARAKIQTLIIAGDKPGGGLTASKEVENWPAVVGESGAAIMTRLTEQVEMLGAEIIDDAVEKIDFSCRPFKVYTYDNGVIEAHAIVLATGSEPKKLGIPGEQEYWGRGVSSCAVCDGFLYEGLDVAIVGGGDSAVEEALQLEPIAKKITVFLRSDRFRAAPRVREKLFKYKNKIDVVYNTKVIEVLGDGDKVTGLRTQDSISGEIDHFPVDGLFLAIGYRPNSTLFSDWIHCDEKGYIKLYGRSQATNIPGVFAAGDVADGKFRKAITALGSGAQAALEAIDFLRYDN